MRPKVLVVEDEAIVAEAVCDILGDQGFDVNYDFSGEAAMDRIAGQEQVDLVLMDIDLGPGHIDGGTAARLIAERHDIPVIFYSAHDDSRVLSKTRVGDCYGYVRKDIGSAEYLIRSIKTALHRHAIAQRLSKSAEDKTIHLQEAHHRIKNGLTMVRSFLELKQRNEEVDCDLSDVLTRVESLAELHGHVSEEQGNAQIALGSLLDRLLKRVFAASPIPTHYSSDIGEIVLRYEDARTVGLIVVEMGMNAIKHSFLPDGENEFAVKISEEERTIRVDVSVSGRPIDDSVAVDNPSTQGMRLIHALVRQLSGRLEIRRAPTPFFSILFPRRGR